jgi:hypothetical protein
MQQAGGRKRRSAGRQSRIISPRLEKPAVAAGRAEELVSHSLGYELCSERLVAVPRPIDNNITGLSQNMSNTIGTRTHGVLPGRKNGVDRLIDEGYFHETLPAFSLV